MCSSDLLGAAGGSGEPTRFLLLRAAGQPPLPAGVGKRKRAASEDECEEALSLFGTLASLVCKATYNWNPSDLGMLTLPYMLSIAATLLAFPVLVSYFTFTQLLTLVMAEACLGLACIQFPMYPAVPPWRMVLGMCLTGANEKLGQFLPNFFLAASVDTATFAQFVSFILLVDGIIGIFTPTACMWLFANTPAGIWTATFLGSFVITMNMFYTMGVTSIAYSSPLRAAFSGTTKMKM